MRVFCTHIPASVIKSDSQQGSVAADLTRGIMVFSGAVAELSYKCSVLSYSSFLRYCRYAGMVTWKKLSICNQYLKIRTYCLLNIIKTGWHIRSIQ